MSRVLQEAMDISLASLTITNPNPRVGCVLTDSTGAIIAEGRTQQAGGPHAEVMALRAAAEQGIDVMHWWQ